MRTESAWEGHGSNTKPLKMLELLDEGHAEVVWMDSDIIATKDVRELFSGVSRRRWWWRRKFTGANIKADHIAHRAGEWKSGAALPWTANSCVVRATEGIAIYFAPGTGSCEGRSLLRRISKRYDERPIHLLGDQEVLSALLGSKCLRMCH